MLGYPPSTFRGVCKSAVSRTHLLRRAGSASGSEGTVVVVRATFPTIVHDRFSRFVREKLVDVLPRLATETTLREAQQFLGGAQSRRKQLAAADEDSSLAADSSGIDNACAVHLARSTCTSCLASDKGEPLPLLCRAPHRCTRRASCVQRSCCLGGHAANIREAIHARAYAYTEAHDEERPTCIFLHSSRCRRPNFD